jgi:ParB-like chromosome segregation protein Spo0J
MTNAFHGLHRIEGVRELAGQIDFAPLDQIALDPLNPRLGRAAHAQRLDQDQIYEKMKDWSLEELATSFLESGFWPHEAVLCVEEEVAGQKRLVVVEGNRRIAALHMLVKRRHESGLS